MTIFRQIAFKQALPPLSLRAERGNPIEGNYPPAIVLLDGLTPRLYSLDVCLRLGYINRENYESG